MDADCDMLKAMSALMTLIENAEGKLFVLLFLLLFSISWRKYKSLDENIACK